MVDGGPSSHVLAPPGSSAEESFSVWEEEGNLGGWSFWLGHPEHPEGPQCVSPVGLAANAGCQLAKKASLCPQAQVRAMG